VKLIQILLFPVFWLLRKLAKLAIILAVILIVILASGNYWLPHIVRWQIHSKTGFRAHIDSSLGSLFRGYFHFRDFDILNPKNKFDSGAFVSIRELSADVNMKSLLTGVIALDKIVLNVDSVTLVKNADGVCNYQLFAKGMPSQPASNGPTSRENTPKLRERETDAKSGARKIRLGEVVFALKSVKIVDESGVDPAKEYVLNYRRKFTDIEDVNTVIKSLTSDLSKYGISILVQSAFNSILHLPGVDQVTGGITTIKDISKETIHGVGTGIKRLLGK
jgi:uncharacterized protein involved in outer membrane biogenesis